MAPIVDRAFLPDRLGKEWKHSSKVPVFAMILIVVLMLGALAGLIRQTGNSREPLPSETPVKTPARIAYITHSPISIVGDVGFTGPNATTGVVWGSGAESDPYVIEGWDIQGPWGVDRIAVLNAGVHFVIQDCSLHDCGVGSGGSGVYLFNCSNGTIVRCTSFNDDQGILVRQSTEIVIRDSYCYNNSRGISLSGSELSLVTNNTCSDGNCYGIYFEHSSSNNSAIGNNCSYNDYTGIMMSVAWNNTASGNACEHNENGIHIEGANNNNLTNNSCKFNGEGIDIDGSNNTLSNNNCSNNIEDGIRLASSNNTLNDNECLNNGGLYYTGYGIRSDYGSSNSLIDNTCSINDYGIYLYSSSGSTLRNNTCSRNGWGIYLYVSSNNTLSSNNCSSNGADGIYLYASSNFNAIVSNRGFWNSYNGIDVVSSRNNTLVSNHWSSNDYDGAYIGYSTNNTLDSNNCSYNNRWGIQIRNSSGNVMLRNQLCDNLQYGMYIYDASSSNIVFNNTFIGNNGAANTYDSSHTQAYDVGTNNRWNSTEGYGNYWSDWTSPDVAPPYGIVDVPYNISGAAGAKDFFPQTTPQAPIPEFGMMPFVVIALMAVIVVAGETRRKKKS